MKTIIVLAVLMLAGCANVPSQKDKIAFQSYCKARLADASKHLIKYGEAAQNCADKAHAIQHYAVGSPLDQVLSYMVLTYQRVDDGEITPERAKALVHYRLSQVAAQTRNAQANRSAAAWGALAGYSAYLGQQAQPHRYPGPTITNCNSTTVGVTCMTQ